MLFCCRFDGRTFEQSQSKLSAGKELSHRSPEPPHHHNIKLQSGLNQHLSSRMLFNPHTEAHPLITEKLKHKELSAHDSLPPNRKWPLLRSPSNARNKRADNSRKYIGQAFDSNRVWQWRGRSTKSSLRSHINGVEFGDMDSDLL